MRNTINITIEGITIIGNRQYQGDSCFWECKFIVTSRKKEYYLDIPLSDFSKLISSFILDNGRGEPSIEAFLKKYDATNQGKIV
jgi:hypothetical protein